MKGGISRKQTRLSIVLFVVGLAALGAGYFVNGWLPTAAGVVLIVAGLAVRPWKCPTCGKRVSPAPQWSQPGKYHCPFCGSRLAYDDEPEVND